MNKTSNSLLHRFFFHRSSRTEPPELAGLLRATDDIIESLVCPPPPGDPALISEDMISGLIVPAPGWSKYQQLNIFNVKFFPQQN